MKQGKWAIAAVSFILGLMIVLQVKMTREASNSALRVQRAADLSIKLEESEKKRIALEEEIQRLQNNNSNKDVGITNERLRYEAGLTPVKGKGVIITISDSKIKVNDGENPNLYLIHDEDILKVVNELKSAGSEAISINDQRLIAQTEIRCVGPTITVNRKSFAPPYIIKAIGNPDTLTGALMLRGGVMDTLRVWGIELRVDKKDDIVVPAYDGPFTTEYGQKADEGGQS